MLAPMVPKPFHNNYSQFTATIINTFLTTSTSNLFAILISMPSNEKNPPTRGENLQTVPTKTVGAHDLPEFCSEYSGLSTGQSADGPTSQSSANAGEGNTATRAAESTPGLTKTAR
jgi:hypothetical protein